MIKKRLIPVFLLILCLKCNLFDFNLNYVPNIISSVKMVYDINPSGSLNPINLTVYNNRLYFGADDGTNGSELWYFFKGDENLLE